MARFVESLSQVVDGTPSSIQINWPDHKTGDILIYAVGQDSATGFSTPSGYTAHGTFASNAGVGMQFFSKKALSDNEADPTVTGVADDWTVWVGVIRGAGTVAVAQRSNHTSAFDFLPPAASSTSNDTLVIWGACIDSTAIIVADPDVIPLYAYNQASSIGMVVCCGNQRTAGAVRRPRFYTDQNDEGGNAWTLIVTNDTGGAIQADATAALTMIDAMNTTTGRTLTALSADYTTIDGDGVETAVTAAQQVQVGDPGPWCIYVSFSSALANTLWAGGTLTLGAAVDLANADLCFRWRLSSVSGVDNKGAIVVIRDSAGAWVAYTLATKAGLAAAPSFYTSHIALGSATPLASSGTMDWSSSLKFSFAYRRNNTTSVTRIEVSAIFYSKAGSQVFIGGSADAPVSLKTVADITQGLGFGRSGLVDFQGDGQMLLKNHIQFGDGATPTYLDLNGQSLQSPRPYNAKAGRKFFNVPDGILSVTLRACAACVMRVRNFGMATILRSTMRVHAGSSTSATYEFNGALISNTDFIDEAGIPVVGAIFDSAWPAQTVAGTSFNNCTFNNPRGTASVLMTAGNTFTDCRFNADDAAKFAGIISTPGDYYFHGCTWEGSTDDLSVTAASGTVTLHFDLGDQIPDWATAGATVVVDQPVESATGSVVDMPAGGRLYLFNVTTNTEMVNAIQAGTSYTTSYPTGTGYSAGDTILMRWRHPLYEDVEATTTATSGGWSFTVATDFDPHYTATTPANVTVDYVNQKIRATGTRFQITAQELVDVIKVAEATEAGIRLEPFADISGLVELTPGTFTALTINMLDWQLSWAAGSVGQAFVTGGNVVGGLAGDLIEDVAGGPQVTVLQAQSGTVVAVGSGVLPSDITAIAAEVRAQLAVELARIDVATSSVAADNASIAAIRNLVEADEIQTDTTIEKRQRGTSTVLLTKNWTGKPLKDFQAVQP